jgi:hypothetical protein
MPDYTFVISSWDASAHDVALHAARAKGWMTERPLWRIEDVSDVRGPVVVEHGDGSASVTYSMGA